MPSIPRFIANRWGSTHNALQALLTAVISQMEQSDRKSRPLKIGHYLHFQP